VAKQGVRARYRETPYTTDEGKKRIDKSYDLYVDRAMIAQEFDALWAAQAALQAMTVTNATTANEILQVVQNVITNQKIHADWSAEEVNIRTSPAPR
jgi:hypothetical protein